MCRNGVWFENQILPILPGMDEREPLEITAGDTVEWTRTLSDYPADDGWTLNYALRGPAKVDLTSEADGSSHKTTITSIAITVAGTYYVQGYVTKDSERHTVYTGRIKVNPNLAGETEATYDGRCHAQRVIDAIEAVIEGRAAKDQLEMQIDGRRISKTPFEELIRIRQQYRLELATITNKEKRKQGRGVGRTVKFRL